MSNNEWYTPSKYIEAAREVMGGIDLDPASCELANQIVKATRYITQEDDGLTQEWRGRIWLNPPYSSNNNSPSGMRGGQKKGQTGAFVSKLIESYEKGDVLEAIVCVVANAERTWFKNLWKYTICFPSHAVLFIRPNLKTEHHYFGTAFVYLGPNEKKIIEVFSQFGTIVKEVPHER